jgi:hypothetical protein
MAQLFQMREKWGVEEMKGAAAPIHFCHGRGGVLHGEGEQAAAVLSREAVGWPSAGGRRKIVGPRLG